MAVALIGIGSNLGNAEETVRHALVCLAEIEGVSVATRSRLYRTRPVGGPAGQGDFVNAAAVLETSLAPHSLLQTLHEVEARFGRMRSERWAARTLDLDLLLFDDKIIKDAELVVPHPRMSFRRFVLEPAAEIVPDMLHPTSGRRISELLRHLDAAPQYLAIGSPCSTAAASLATVLAQELGSPLLAHGAGNATPSLPETATVPSLVQSLEFARRGAELLSRERWRTNARLQPLLDPWPAAKDGPPSWSPAVSDFWLDQWRLWACLRRPNVDAGPAEWIDYQQALKQCATYQEAAVCPKLVAWLDVASPLTNRIQDRLPDCLPVLFHHSRCGAVLRLSEDDPDRMLEECLAAIDAMRPADGVIS